jgi:hypothetical protein
LVVAERLTSAACPARPRFRRHVLTDAVAAHDHDLANTVQMSRPEAEHRIEGIAARLWYQAANTCAAAFWRNAMRD